MTMLTADVRNLIIATPLEEQGISNPAWPNANLIIRELSGKAGSELLVPFSDKNGNIIDQTGLMAAVILSTLRNADDPNKALVFEKDDGSGEPNPAYKDSLMAIGLGKLMNIANASIKLSGLSAAAQVAEAKNG